MILLSFLFFYLAVCFASSLIKTQDQKHKIKVEQDRQKTVLREALRQNARMR